MSIYDEIDFGASSIDIALKRMDDEERFHSVRDLTSWGKNASEQKWVSGTRVAFLSNLDSLLTYPSCPDPGTPGTVVTVRTARGDMSVQDDYVFVLWDDGEFRPVLAKHLKAERTKRANAVRMVVGSLGDISSFFSSRGDDLVHKATKDLWSLRKEGDQYVIERLFSEDGKPLKV